MRRKFIPDDFDGRQEKPNDQAPRPKEKPMWMLVEEAIHSQGLEESFAKVMGNRPEVGSEITEEDDYQGPPSETRPCRMASESHRHPQGREINFEKLMETMRRRKSAREQAREAKAASAQPQPLPLTKKNTKELTIQRKGQTEPPTTPPATAGPSKGTFLFTLKRGEITWRLQLFAFEGQGGSKITKLHFHPWQSGKDGLLVSCGPGRGFSLSLKEAALLIKALQNGLKMIDSGEFDPNAEGNILPRRT